MEQAPFDKYKELCFVNESILSSSKKELNIVLLLHSWVLSTGLQCVGLKQEDSLELNDGIEIPQDWQQSEEGVYSFKYQDKKTQECFMINLIVGENGLVSVNAVSLNNTSKLFTSTLNFSSFDVSKPESATSLFNSFQKNILHKLVPPTNTNASQTTTTQNQTTQQYRPVQLTPVLLQPVQPILQSNSGYGIADLRPNFNNPMHVNGIFSQNQQQYSGNQIFRPPGSRYDPLGPMPEINGVPDDIEPGFLPNNRVQRPPFGGFDPNRLGSGGRNPNGMGGPFGGGFGGFNDF